MSVRASVEVLTDEEAAEEGGGQIEARGVDERDVVARVQLALVHEQRADALRSLVELGAGERRLGLTLQTQRKLTSGSGTENTT